MHLRVEFSRSNNVDFFNFGLSDRSEILSLEIFDDLGQRVSGTSRIVQPKQVFENRTVKIKLETLDQLTVTYPKLWKTRLIKCDVEGFELKVFRGAKRIIDHARPIIIAEVGSVFGQENDSETLFDFFNKFQYESYVTISKNLIRPSLESGSIPEGQRPNRIFLPQEYQIQKSIKIDR